MPFSVLLLVDDDSGTAKQDCRQDDQQTKASDQAWQAKRNVVRGEIRGQSFEQDEAKKPHGGHEADVLILLHLYIFIADTWTVESVYPLPSLP